MTLERSDLAVLRAPISMAAIVAMLAIGFQLVTSKSWDWIDSSQLLIALTLLRLAARVTAIGATPLPFGEGRLVTASGTWLVTLSAYQLTAAGGGWPQFVVLICGTAGMVFGLRMSAYTRL